MDRETALYVVSKICAKPLKIHIKPRKNHVKSVYMLQKIFEPNSKLHICEVHFLEATYLKEML